MPTLPTLEEIRRNRSVIDRLMNETLIQRTPGNEATARAYLGDRSTMNLVTPLAQDDSMSPMNMAMGLIGGPSLRGSMAGVAGGIRAFHGSPHKFDKFDMSRIGTGEGAQAYGHGLYFAENEATAKSYRDALGSRSLPTRVADGPNAVAQQWLRDVGGDRKAALKAYDDFIANSWPKHMQAADAGSIKQVRDLIQAPPGHMYEVNIRANPEQFLDWDRPLSGQPQPVREMFGFKPRATDAEEQAVFALAKERGVPVHTLPEYRALESRMDAASGLDRNLRTGEQIYNSIASRSAPRMDPLNYVGIDKPAATQVLREAGIPGIKYLDQGSRSAGQGSSNYVLFDDSIIDILKRYGLMGAMGVPGAAELLEKAQAGKRRQTIAEGVE